MPLQILLIDDDALMRSSLSFSLKQAGYDVLTASSAELGLALAQAEPPRLVLLDLELPGMDGLQALPHFRAIGVSIIFLTARRQPEYERLALEGGANAYVTKPFDTDALLLTIEETLRSAA